MSQSYAIHKLSLGKRIFATAQPHDLHPQNLKYNTVISILIQCKIIILLLLLLTKMKIPRKGVDFLVT